jgi:hypothetical protein
MKSRRCCSGSSFNSVFVSSSRASIHRRERENFNKNNNFNVYYTVCMANGISCLLFYVYSMYILQSQFKTFVLSKKIKAIYKRINHKSQHSNLNHRNNSIYPPCPFRGRHVRQMADSNIEGRGEKGHPPGKCPPASAIATVRAPWAKKRRRTKYHKLLNVG